MAVTNWNCQRPQILHFDSHNGSLHRRRRQLQQISCILYQCAQQKILHQLLLLCAVAPKQKHQCKNNDANNKNPNPQKHNIHKTISPHTINVKIYLYDISILHFCLCLIEIYRIVSNIFFYLQLLYDCLTLSPAAAPQCFPCSRPCLSSHRCTLPAAGI